MPISPEALFLIAASPFVGSFAGTLILRLPAGRPFAGGRSVCDACGQVLGPLELVPLVSWAILRGHCRHCGVRLGWFYPGIELGAAAVTAWAATRFNGVMLGASAVLGWGLLVASAIAWRARGGSRVLVVLVATVIWIGWLYLA